MQVSTNLGNPTTVMVHLDYNVNLLGILVFTRFDPDAKKSTEPTFLRTYLIKGKAMPLPDYTFVCICNTPLSSPLPLMYLKNIPLAHVYNFCGQHIRVG